MSKNLHARDFLSSSALSLTLAGIFRDGGATAKERSGGGEEETVEISSENSGPRKSTSRPAEEDDSDELVDNDDEDQQHDPDCNNRNKKKKKYHRHTPEQIKEMEALFKESPHPDEKQRLQMSKQLGLHPRQVKFWFQNRRTQIKAIQERHENSLLRTEIDKLREENKALRDNIKTPSCSNCGFATCTTKAAIRVTETEEQNLRTENAKLRAEVEKLRSIIVKDRHGTSPHSSSYTSGNDQENTSSLEICTGNFVLEKSRIVDAAKRAMHEMVKMASHGDPLWTRSYESGREMLNYDEYLKEFCVKNSGKTQPQKSIIEASRESEVVFVDLAWLVQSFMDVNQWKQLFPCLVSKAATLDVICDGAGVNRDGAVQLMFAEIQMLTPKVATREVCFIRHCRQLSANRWAVADVSIDKVEDNIDVSTQKCRKLPSGCIIEDKSNGHCKVTWVEHMECQKSTVYSLYRTIVNNGLAFGAKHWISTLQQQCERLVFLVATNVPTKYSSGVATLAGRKSIMQLAQRMTLSFYKTVGASSRNSWNKITTKTGYEIRVASRQNLNDPGEPLGMILSAVTCVWLSVPCHVLFEFLGDESRRKEWDITSNGSTVQTIANLAKGKDRGNAVTTLAMKINEHTTWVLQDSSTNAYESTVVYAPVDVKGMKSVMTGCESSKFAVLPSGFSILPDGIESRPSVITSSWPEEKCTEGGSLLTVAFQILISSSPAEKLPGECLDSINTLISCTLQNIKTSLHCED